PPSRLYPLSLHDALPISQLAAKGDVPVKELAKPFRISLPAVSRHLSVLENAGLITRGREAQRRPARLEAAPLRDVSDWVERYRQDRKSTRLNSSHLGISY